MRVLIACEFSGTVRDSFLGHDVLSCDLLPTDKPGPHYQGNIEDVLDGWVPVKHADEMSECEMCGEAFCKDHNKHYYECGCYGPTQDELEYEDINNVLMARPVESPHWDLMICHPPCTYLTGAAEWAFDDRPMINGKPRKMKSGTLIGETRRQARKEALEFVDLLWAAPIKKICLENPVGVIPANRPDMPKPQYVQQYWFGEDASKKTGLWLKGLSPLRATDMIEPRIINGLKRWGNQTDSGQNKLTPSVDRWKIRSVTPQGLATAMAEQWGKQ